MQNYPLGKAKALEGRAMNAIWIYVDPSKEVGDLDHLKVFASKEAAETWLQEK